MLAELLIWEGAECRSSLNESKNSWPTTTPRGQNKRMFSLCCLWVVELINCVESVRSEYLVSTRCTSVRILRNLLGFA